MDHSHWFTSTQVLTSLILPILIVSSFLFPITTSQESPFLYKICKNDSAGSYTQTDPFAKNLKNVLDDLVDQTPKHDGLKKKASKSARMFAQGSAVEKKENATIYGMAQCGRDLSSGNCTSCLDYAINVLPAFTATTSPVGGRTLTGSCTVRYETYVFLDGTTKKKAVNVKMVA
ncbi:Putative cysteine-rich repeat secretory protein 10 [Striga hermonthica]|uniref:Cysteine-rich repeat secretory protein 10 n=1 Tax=Striga hermonthica TaxID=68872 RepID=A0A9N7N9J4_STRHE|nr:Putative cysteine-rich repeat secretory protein 10 [Striga hermonthica]